MKAVAEDRGWANNSHPHLRDIARQFYLGTRDKSISDLFRNVEWMHKNFYEDEAGWDQVEETWVDAEMLLERLEALQGKPPGSYFIKTEDDQARTARLMGGGPPRVAPGPAQSNPGQVPS